MKNKTILLISVVLVLAIIGAYFGGLLSVISFGDWRDNEPYKTETGDLEIFYQLPNSERTTGVGSSYSTFWDYDVKHTGVDTGSKVLDVLGFPVTIRASNSHIIDGRRYTLHNYEITYGGVTKTAFSPVGVNAVSDSYMYQYRYVTASDSWEWWARTETLKEWIPAPEINYDTTASFKDGQLIFKPVGSGYGCNARVYNVWTQECGGSKLSVEFNPDVTIDDISIDRLLTETGYNKTEITITNNFGDFNALLHFEVEFEALSGKTEKLSVDKIITLKEGTNVYDIESSSFLITANQIKVDLFVLQKTKLLQVAHRTSSGTEYLSGDTSFWSLNQPPKPALDDNGNILYYNLRESSNLNLGACDKFDYEDSRSDSKDCWQEFTIKKAVASQIKTDLGDIFVNLQSDLQDKINAVKELQGNIEAQAILIGEISTNLNESKEILAGLELEREEYLVIVQTLTEKNSELAQYVEQLEGNYVEIIELMKLPIQDNAEILADMNLTLEEYGDVLGDAGLSTDEMVVYVSKLQEKNIDAQELIVELKSTVEETQAINDGLVEYNLKKRNENIILYSIIVALSIGLIFVMWRFRRK